MAEAIVLSHISVHIEAGQTVALVGPTGSGKSTLISLLARLHDPPPNTVFVDGVDVRTLPLDTLRGAIGFVPQEPFLFSDTLADNVAFGMDARPAGGSHGTNRTARRSRAARADSSRRRASRASTRTSRTSREATTRWSVSAASRCPAVRSSGPRSHGPWPSIRAS